MKKGIMKMTMRVRLISLLVTTMFLAGCGQQNTAPEVAPVFDPATVVTTVEQPTTPQEALERLESQNQLYVDSLFNTGDISGALRLDTAENGQSPYAVVLTCSDSRVVPEHIFMEGLGALFTIRNAGNVVDDIVLGSVEYGAEHLGAQVVLVLGHTQCGAVDATIQGGAHGHIEAITQVVGQNIQGQTDARQAETLNVQSAVTAILESHSVAELVEAGKLVVLGGIYDAHTGAVSFLHQESQPQAPEVDLEALYHTAVVDAMEAEPEEVFPLVSLHPDDPMTTWDEQGRVLLLTWNKYPDSYRPGETVTLSYGAVWTFTDKELLAWYQEEGTEVEDLQLRLNQLIGLPPQDDNTHITAFWADPADVVRPAYATDVTVDAMDITLAQQTEQDYRTWFEGNIIGSYYGDYLYPWTRLGYTYDWADNGQEYGLSEFLVAADAQVEVAYTLPTQDFFAELA